MAKITNFRVVKNENDEFFIQNRRWGWPFWFFTHIHGYGVYRITFYEFTGELFDPFRNWGQKESYRSYEEARTAICKINKRAKEDMETERKDNSYTVVEEKEKE